MGDGQSMGDPNWAHLANMVGGREGARAGQAECSVVLRPRASKGGPRPRSCSRDSPRSHRLQGTLGNWVSRDPIRKGGPGCGPALHMGGSWALVWGRTGTGGLVRGRASGWVEVSNRKLQEAMPVLPGIQRMHGGTKGKLGPLPGSRKEGYRAGLPKGSIQGDSPGAVPGSQASPAPLHVPRAWKGGWATLLGVARGCSQTARRPHWEWPEKP